MSAYIANAVRENHHHHDKREHTTKMTVSVKPTYKLSQPHKYGYEYNNRRQRMGKQSNQQDDNGIQHIRDQQLHSICRARRAEKLCKQEIIGNCVLQKGGMKWLRIRF